MVPETYRALLRVPGARRLMLAGFIGRIPIAMTSLAIVLLVRETTGSFAKAGVVTAVYAIGGGIAAPVLGRLVDLLGQPRVLIPAAVVNSVAVVGVVLAALHDAPQGLLLAAAALAGATIPPLSACMRALWGSMLDDTRRLESAYAVESVSLELFFVSGPVLTAAIAAVASPAAALVTAAALSLVGTAIFTSGAVSRNWRSAGRRGSRAGALASAGMRTLVLAVLPAGIAFGTLEVTLPAFADERGAAETGGIFLALLALGSMTGGLFYGARHWDAPLDRRYIQLTACFTIGLALPPLVHVSWAMGLLMFVAGLTLAPVVTVCYSLIDLLAPIGTATEAYTWVITANVAGTALGTAIAGTLVEHSNANRAMLAAAAGAAVGWVVAVTRRRTLRRA